MIKSILHVVLSFCLTNIFQILCFSFIGKFVYSDDINSEMVMAFSLFFLVVNFFVYSFAAVVSGLKNKVLFNVWFLIITSMLILSLSDFDFLLSFLFGIVLSRFLHAI